MSNIISPVLPVGGAELSVEHVRGAEKSGNKFADHLDRRLDAEQNRNQDQLGVRRCEKQCASPKNDKASREEAKAEPGSDGQGPEEQSDVDNLVLFLQDIQEVAQEKTLGPGEWSVALPEAEILADLAEQAGMTPADLTAMVEQFQADNGELDLNAFFQSLINHFISFEENPAVVVPETEFPMLEALLAKMGLSPEQLDSVSSQAVVGDGEIDLSALAQSLEQLNIVSMAAASSEGDAQFPTLKDTDLTQQQPLQTITLSPWEAEQLQALLDKAGLPLADQLALLPEQVFGEDLILSFERLQSLLQEAVIQAQEEQPQLNLPKFLGSLEQVMQQASFEDQSVGFTPVVQNSLGEAYQNLMEMYDQARLRFEEGLGAEEDQLQNDIQKWLDGVVARATEEQAGEGGSRKEGFSANLGLVSENMSAGSGEEFAVHRQEGLVAGQTSSGQTISSVAEQPQPVRHFPAQQQQQILNQLSLAVARGMKSGEQHLVLRMHPAELGEVKVDLTVRNQVVTVSFAMENSKVKETLEGSMEEFRHNMEQKGFSLGDVNVFVGQNEQDNGAWQRFEMAWSGEKLEAQNLGDIPEDVLYRTAGGSQYVSQEEGVNLFV